MSAPILLGGDSDVCSSRLDVPKKIEFSKASAKFFAPDF